MKIVTEQFGHKSFSLSWNMLNNQGSKVLHCYCCQSIKTRCYSAEKKKLCWIVLFNKFLARYAQISQSPNFAGNR